MLHRNLPHALRSNLPFLLHRLDLQKVQEDANPASHRLSLDRQHRIQEEFTRLQSSQTEASDDGLSEAIDWGEYKYVALVSESANSRRRVRLLGKCHGR